MEAQSNIRKVNEARQSEGVEEKINKEENEPQLMGEAKTAMANMFDLNADLADNLTLEEKADLLNDDQRCIFDR